MKRSTRVLDRVIVGVIGLLFIGGGLWLVGYREGVAPAVTGAHRLRPRAIADAPQQDWWALAVGGAGVILVLLTVWLLLRHLRPATSVTVQRPGGTVDIGRLAAAAADDLERHPAFDRARVAVRREGGRVVVRIKSRVDPAADVDELSRVAAAVRRELQAAAGPEVVVQVLAEPGDAETTSRVI
ncbi:hypothetical protein [Tsukamurella sp. 1534]|uniref:hypothetical protein n=1 Tax=Tsukamurella sp. 1534 TaxID=1151061 RepID=UPI0002FBE0A0|nr:hypothetical protein [Tsukamurella sp. 1534]